MKAYWKSIAVLAIILLTTQLGVAQKFGYLNSASILAEMPEVKQAEANLEALQKQLQKKLQQGVEKLQADYAALQQRIESGDLSPKQQEEQVADLKAREMQLAEQEQEMMKQIQTKRSEELQPIYDKVNQAIQDVAQENGFQFIFDQSVLLYNDPSQDVSSLVKAKLGI